MTSQILLATSSNLISTLIACNVIQLIQHPRYLQRHPTYSASSFIELNGIL